MTTTNKQAPTTASPRVSMLSCDSPEKHPRDLTADAELLVGFTDLYSKSCDQKDYGLCRLLRDQVEILVSGQKTGIKIENDLGLSGKLF